MCRTSTRIRTAHGWKTEREPRKWRSWHIDTFEEPDIHQHFVCIKLKYEYFGEDNAPIKTPQDAMIDATDTDEDDSYLPLLETENGDEVIITPIIDKRDNH